MPYDTMGSLSSALGMPTGMHMMPDGSMMPGPPMAPMAPGAEMMAGPNAGQMDIQQLIAMLLQNNPGLIAGLLRQS